MQIRISSCKNLLLVFFFLVPALAAFCQVKVHSTFLSPNKKTSFQVGLTGQGSLMYRMLESGNEVVTWSPLGFVLNGIVAGEKTAIGSKTERPVSTSFDWRLGENDRVQNVYNEFKLTCASGPLDFSISGRVYNSSVAFRYQLPSSSDTAILKKEFTQFILPADYTIYQYHEESEYKPTSIDTLRTASDLPSTLEN